jgi:hypothetical protein
VTPSLDQLLQTLQDEGHLQAADTEAVRDRALSLDNHPLALATPRVLRVISGMAAWLASAFFLSGLAVLLLVFKAVWLPLGGIAIGAAAILRRFEPRTGQDALHGAALALVLTGIGLIEAGLVDLGMPEDLLAPAFAAVCLVVLGLYPDPAGRFLAALGVLGGTLSALVQQGDVRALDLALPLLAVAGWEAHLARTRTHLGPGRHLQAPVAAALTWTALVQASKACFDPAPQQLALTVQGLLLLATVALVLRLLLPHRETLGVHTLVAAALGTIVIGVSTWTSPGVLAALGFAVVGVQLRDRVLIGTAMVALVGYGLWAYYALTWPFQLKALAMLLSGASLLGLRAGLRALEAP